MGAEKAGICTDGRRDTGAAVMPSAQFCLTVCDTIRTAQHKRGRTNTGDHR
ncbi:hypothetical protein ROA7023_02030 [Roseisalinus antarcticus]|uniref:Uncharacterized protein n=1 Tax=Roseisalinus antarcticus TaxID=254357 RepID=A0A1Y5SY23_9RHOB|nr:hypothetical protein ROA7023_02030 [Roseisalinus antarcticus]